MWLCNVVVMFSYANILFAKWIMVTCFRPKSCLKRFATPCPSFV